MSEPLETELADEVRRLEAEIERLNAQVQHEIKVGCEAEEEIERLRAELKRLHEKHGEQTTADILNEQITK